MTTKSEAAALVAAGQAHETFHHATLGHFNITRLREVIAQGGFKLHRCKFDDLKMVDGIEADAFAYLTANREIDPARVAELTEQQIREPLLFALCPPGSNGEGESHLLLDGIHRFVARRQRGKTFFTFIMVPLAEVPIVDPALFAGNLPWGEKDVVPGVGLVNRREKY
jgi:hypothetical protein